MSNELLQKLRKIHKSVLHNFTYKTDREQYGEEEKWVLPEDATDQTGKLVGDCEDFALACRAKCRKVGIDNSRLVVCLTEDNQGHCVLEVEGWILDNRQTDVVPRDKLQQRGYKWIAISGYNPGDEWYRVE
jgi:predicted transglutaminase-like cysteine proteinase